MKNFKALVTAALVATTTLVAGATGAEARNYACYYTTSNDHVCIYAIRGNRYEKEFKMDINGRYAGVQYVYCNPAHRYNYKENANGKACFEFS